MGVIRKDCTDSWESLGPVRAEILKEIAETGLDSTFARMEGLVMDKLQGYFAEGLGGGGGVGGYLEEIGIDVDKRLVGMLGMKGTLTVANLRYNLCSGLYLVGWAITQGIRNTNPLTLNPV